jgi:hypothetical protein
MSTTELQEAKTFLLHSDQEFRELVEHHQHLDDRLQQLSEKSYLSELEHVEQVTLKKRKLALKDQMESVVRDYARRHGQPS